MLSWRRQAVTALASWKTVPFVFLRGRDDRLLLHTHAVHWTRSDDEVEHCQLLTFRPLECSDPLRALTVNDATRASTALRYLREGWALVYAEWDYHNARQLLAAVKRKCGGTSGAHRRKERSRKKKRNAVQAVASADEMSTEQLWLQQRRLQREQADIVSKLLIQISLEGGRPSQIVGLKRTPTNAKDIVSFAFQNDQCIEIGGGSAPSPPSYFLLSINDFLAMIGGYEWNRKGVCIDASQDLDRIYPHFGVFSPTRQDYIQLLDYIKVDRTQNGSPVRMMEVGIGTGVLSMILLQRNVVDRVIATDVNHYAVACARDNMQRLGLQDRVDDIIETDLFPPSDATWDNEKQTVDVVLFNPPWIPGEATSYFDSAVYDPEQSILRRFLLQAQHYVKEDGHIYLMLSNLGVLLELFQMEDLYKMFEAGNLEVVGVHETKSRAKTVDGRSTKDVEELDGIASARAQEVISLYHLRLKSGR